MFDRTKYLKSQSGLVSSGNKSNSAWESDSSESISQSKNFYKNLYHAAVNHFVVWDIEGAMIKANHLPGDLKFEALEGHKWKPLFPQHLVDQKQRVIDEVAENGGVGRFQVELPENGTLVQYRCTVIEVEPFRGERRFLETMEDISSIVESERIAKKERDFSEAITKTTPMLIYVYDLEQHKLVYTNREFSAHLEKTVEEMNEYDQGFLDLVVPEDRERIQSCMRHIQEMKADETKYFEYRLDSPKEGRRHLATWARTFKQNEEGIVTQIIGAAYDITEMKETEKQIEKQRAFYQAVFEGSVDNLWIFNTKGEVVDANHSKFWGGLDEVSGMKWKDHFDDEVIDSVLNTIAEAQKNKKTASNELDVRLRGNKNRFLNRARAIPSHSDEELILLSSFDITELHATQRQLKIIIDFISEQQRNLMDANKELEQFAYIVSHDLQSPVRNVKQFLELIKLKEKELSEDSLEYLRMAHESCDQMIQLIKGLLEFSRLGRRELEMERIDGEEFIEQTLAFETIGFEQIGATITRDDFPAMICDPLLIRQLYRNLISNSVKFRKEDVPLSLHFGCEDLKDEWKFSVEDNGMGVAEKYHETIFGIYQRGAIAKSVEGNGIGLALAKRVVSRHGGEIWVKSGKGIGTKVCFTLPKS